MYQIEGPQDGGKWPNGPNFLLIVALFGAAILVCFGLAFLLIPHLGSYFHAVRHYPHPMT
ncbi:MAG TPA: hypothetical protein VG714_03510 [Acidobacteriaceae bacterium]|nr:hypothetical protein [Acidobacteriaceae bacterium]